MRSMIRKRKHSNRNVHGYLKVFTVMIHAVGTMIVSIHRPYGCRVSAFQQLKQNVNRCRTFPPRMTYILSKQRRDCSFSSSTNNCVGRKYFEGRPPRPNFAFPFCISRTSFRKTTRKHYCSAANDISNGTLATSQTNKSCLQFEGMTVRQALQTAVDFFDHHNVLDSVPSAIQLLALALKLPWETGYRDLMRILEYSYDPATLPMSDRQLSHQEAIIMQEFVNRRMQHEPLQYIAGQWDFLAYTLEVRAPLLCPRPETEELVQLVLHHVRKEEEEKLYNKSNNNRRDLLRVLDVGCGTGCIGIALADQICNSHITAIDIEPIAVETAERNAQRVLGDSWKTKYMAQLKSCSDYINEQRIDLVVSNPPYIPLADMKLLERTVIEYESRDALHGGGTDGMDVIRCIVKNLSQWCRLGATCWMEVDPSQPEILQEWIHNDPSLEVSLLSVHQDMFGNDRFVKLVVKPTSLSSTE